MQFYFVRHGKTHFNQQQKVQGWCDSPLIAEGVATAREAGKKLAHVKFARAYSSDAGRACQTLAELLDARAAVRGEAAPDGKSSVLAAGTRAASPIAASPSPAFEPSATDATPTASPSTPGAARWLTQLDAAHAKGQRREESDGKAPCNYSDSTPFPLFTDARLREWCYGDLETQSGRMLHRRLVEGFGTELSFAEENERLPETANNLARLDASGRAETFDVISARLWSFLREEGAAMLAAGGGNAVATTHAFTIRTLIYLLDKSRINEQLRIANGSITRISYDGAAFTLHEIGQ